MIYEKNAEESLKNTVFPQTKKDDFENFWSETIDFLRSKELKISRKKLDLPYDKTFITYEVQYSTHDDTVVSALYSVPNDGKSKHPCVVYFHGGGEKKEIHPDIVATGVCCFAIDVRSQEGTTVDKAIYNSGDIMGGIMTRGVLDKNEFYMRNIYMDAVRAVDVVASFSEVDSGKIVTYGGSQGGALSITAAALNDKVSKCFTAVTSYCCIPKRVDDGTGVFASTHKFLKAYPEYTDQVMDVLSYFDVNNLASLLSVPAEFCIALSDEICYPKYVYSAYEHCNSEKELVMVPYAPHCIPYSFKMKVFTEFAKMAEEVK